MGGGSSHIRHISALHCSCKFAYTSLVHMKILDVIKALYCSQRLLMYGLLLNIFRDRDMISSLIQKAATLANCCRVVRKQFFGPTHFSY